MRLGVWQGWGEVTKCTPSPTTHWALSPGTLSPRASVSSCGRWSPVTRPKSVCGQTDVPGRKAEPGVCVAPQQASRPLITPNPGHP